MVKLKFKNIFFTAVIICQFGLSLAVSCQSKSISNLKANLSSCDKKLGECILELERKEKLEKFVVSCSQKDDKEVSELIQDLVESASENEKRKNIIENKESKASADDWVLMRVPSGVCGMFNTATGGSSICENKPASGASGALQNAKN